MLFALRQIPSYIQIVGIILGMITIGYLGDRIGRKWGSVTTVSIMFVRLHHSCPIMCRGPSLSSFVTQSCVMCNCSIHSLLESGLGWFNHDPSSLPSS